jgi:PAS domain S-box-containing protein
MNLKNALESLGARRQTRRTIAWIGGLFIAAIVGLEGYNIVRGYQTAVANTGRELDSLARVIAEQTARTLQAVDLQLRHLARQYGQGRLSGLSTAELRAQLAEYAVGLVQIEGFLIVAPDGAIRASSYMTPEQESRVNVSGRPLLMTLRGGPNVGLFISGAQLSRFDARWMFPMGRRLETASGDFAGLVAARGRIDHFENLYRDTRPDEGTAITLALQDGTLLARYPRVESALGKRLPAFDGILAADKAGGSRPWRTVSSIDGLERLGALRLVGDYPLAVIVTRDTSVALAAWRSQSLWGVVHVVLLSALAALLLALVMRQLSRLQGARERFALVVAGSNDGIIDWDIANDRMYASERTMEIVGLAPDSRVRTRAEWLALLPLHPEDRERHTKDLREFLQGRGELREGEYRMRPADGKDRWVRVRNLCVRDAAGRATRLIGSVSDIDAQKRAEASLRESEERFALAVAGANDGIVDWDMINDRFYSSKRAMEIVGIESETTVRTREEWRSGIQYHPDDRQPTRDGLERFLAGRDEVRDIGFRVVRADGSLRWVRIRQICVRDADGKPLRLVGSISDVTSEKRAQEALRESEERFALAVAGANDGIVDLDIADTRMFMSERAMEILGVQSAVSVRPRDEWMKLLRFHPEDVQRLEESYRWILQGEGDMREGEYRVRRGDGAYRWVRIRGKTVRDAAGKSVRWAGSVSDIDAEKRAAEALRRNEERFALAVAGSNDGIWDFDFAAGRVFVSARAREIVCVPPGPELMPIDEWLERLSRHVHPEDEPRRRDAMEAHLAGETPAYEGEYRVRHPEGGYRWVHVRGLCIRDADGKPLRMAGSVSDIDAQKRAEAALRESQAQLLQAKKLEAIGTLAGGIAHDFNNILSAILGYGEMAQKDSAEGTPLRRHIDAAMSAGMRAKSLVERILAFSRSGIGERRPVNVQAVVGEALDLVESSLPTGVRLERTLSAGDAAVLGDPTQIHQVVMNLCTNSVQAMRTKGTLAVSLDLVEKGGSVAATSALPGGAYVRLAVRDTGSGIAPGLLERIFDPFFTTKEVGVGTGLGLSMVHGIVTDLGGGIDVDSRPGEGSTFTVYLPRSGSAAATTNIEEVVPNGAGETVLLVDDEEGLVRLGEEMIASLGYEPVGFASATVALETFRASPERFDAVLSDEAMPDMTGSELAREIRAIRPDVPVVLMSGFVSAALLARARDLGVAEVLAKPLVARDIARGLASALRNGGYP